MLHRNDLGLGKSLICSRSVCLVKYNQSISFQTFPSVNFADNDVVEITARAIITCSLQREESSRIPFTLPSVFLGKCISKMF